MEFQLDRLGDPPLWGLGGGELDAVLLGLDRVASRVQTRCLGLVAEAGSRNRAAAVGASSPPSWPSQLLHLTPAAAARHVAHARILDTAAVDPVTAPIVAQARFGSIGVEQAVVAAEAVAAPPADLSVPERIDSVTAMREVARQFDPAQLRRIGGHLLEVVDPDRAEQPLASRLADQERTATARRGMVISPPRDGLVNGRFALPPADAAVVLEALRPLAAPNPAADPAPDPWIDPAGAREHGVTRDDRSHARRMADALVELCRRALDDGELSSGGGEKPHLVVTVPLDQLRERMRALGTLLDGTELSAATVRRLARDAGVLPAVLGSGSQPLDIGRQTRIVPTGLRRALLLRDRGCAFPGCDRPPAWCDAHHVRHWADGGETALANLVLRCGHHHRHTHGDTGWTVGVTADGRVEWLAPPWLDPRQRPIPAHPFHPPPFGEQPIPSPD